MSAYVVDRDHIRFLLDAAMSPAIIGHGTHEFRWYHGGVLHGLPCGDFDRAGEVGQMLWEENIASVFYRYEDCDRNNLPGPVDENFVYGRHDPDWYRKVDPVQVIKSCHCYRYQACEHPEYRESEAAAFIDALADVATHRIPGYEEAVWGAPRPKRACV